MSIIDTRLADLETLHLASGSHQRFEDGACLLEAASWLAGESFTDHPECVCPVLATFGRSWNDHLSDDARQVLKPYAAKLVGTRSTSEVESRRSWMACDWLVRSFTPAWLYLAKLDDDAAALEALPELTAVELGDIALPVIERSRDQSRAARDVAWAAARDAAWAAAWAVAWDAAGAAAGDVAWAAAWDALAPTVFALQISALDLFDRMIEVR